MQILKILGIPSKIFKRKKIVNPLSFRTQEKKNLVVCFKSLKYIFWDINFQSFSMLLYLRPSCV